MSAPMSAADDGRHLGDGRLLRADRQELPSLGRGRHRRRARAAAGRAGDHRGRLLYRRAQRGRRRRHRRTRRGAGDGHVYQLDDEDRRPRHRRIIWAGCRPIRSWCRITARQALPDGSPGPSLYCAVIVKPSTRKPAPRPRSTSYCANEGEANAVLDPAGLAAELIRRPSVTPKDEGALDIVPPVSTGLGFTCHRLVFGGDDGSDPIANLYARHGEGRPNLCFAGHTDVVPPGPARHGRSTRLARIYATARCGAAVPST